MPPSGHCQKARIACINRLFEGIAIVAPDGPISSCAPCFFGHGAFTGHGGRGWHGGSWLPSVECGLLISLRTRTQPTATAGTIARERRGSIDLVGSARGGERRQPDGGRGWLRCGREPPNVARRYAASRSRPSKALSFTALPLKSAANSAAAGGTAWRISSDSRRPERPARDAHSAARSRSLRRNRRASWSSSGSVIFTSAWGVSCGIIVLPGIHLIAVVAWWASTNSVRRSRRSRSRTANQQNRSNV